MKKLKVGINARILDTQQLRGWSRYTVELVRGLAQRNVDVVLFSDKTINTSLVGAENLKVVIRRGLNYSDWEQRILASLCREEDVDILHCPINYGLPYFLKTKKILTLHDAIEKAFYDSRKSFWQKLKPSEKKIRLYHLLSQKAADRIITVSEHAKQDIVSWYGVAPEKISVIYEAADEAFQDKNVVTRDLLKKKYPLFEESTLFYVGGVEDRKNIKGLLKAYSLSQKQKKLLIAGGNESQRKELLRLANELKIEKSVIFMGYIEDQDLPSFYHHCHSFIYPSLYEGFGLQAVEAMKMKKPVLAANNSSLKEIVGISECLFDPHDFALLSQKIDWISDSRQAQNLGLRCFEMSKKYSWDRCLDQTVSLYQEVLHEN